LAAVMTMAFFSGPGLPVDTLPEKNLTEFSDRGKWD
jgi:hypothetical protein